ncbi:UbiA family prenyltransferase [Chloroflexota bacterium]
MKVLIHSQFNAISRAGFGYGLTIKAEYGFWDRVIGFLTLIRPVFFVLTPLNAASAAVLALNGYPSLKQCLLGFFTVAFAGCAVNVFNDYVDRERDKKIWQTRAIPSGRVKPGEALLLVILLFSASLLMSWFLFNPVTFFILLLAGISGFVYSLYLRNKVGYLSLPPVIGLIYLGGWSAFSPQTLASSPLPWYLFLLGAVWQASHIMIYYPLHITSGTTNKIEERVPPALFFIPSLRAAVGIGIAFTIITILISALLPLLTPLGILYLIIALAYGIFTLIRGLRLFNDAQNREKGLKAFASLSMFRMIISCAMLLSFFIYRFVQIPFVSIPLKWSWL